MREVVIELREMRVTAWAVVHLFRRRSDRAWLTVNVVGMVV